MSANPARRVNGFESPVARTRFPRALTFEEDLQLLALVRAVETASPALAAAILLLRFYGLRRAELQYLTHVDLVGPAVLVQAKAVRPDMLGPSRSSASPAGCHRSVVERRETRDQFKDGVWRVKDHEVRTVWVPRAGDDPDPRPMQRIRPLLPSKAAGRFILGSHHTLHRDAISQAMERVLHRIDPDLSTHCLRHSFATWLIGRGVNVVRVKELMGHSDLKTTLIYTHLPRRGDPDDLLDRL
ncbi:MAG: tyrosine-type recombinase/integrase [bacterium]